MCVIFGSLSGELCSFFRYFYLTTSKEQDNGYCHDEDALLRDDMESTNAENTEKKNPNDSFAAMTANMNQTMVAMAGNISSMGNALKRIHADTASSSNAKRQKTTTARCDVLSDEPSGDESAESVDSSTLLRVPRAQQEQAPPKSFSEVEDHLASFFGNISQDYDAEEKTSEAVTAKLAEFVNKRFSAKLGDGKYKEKLDKYGRASNCDKVTVPTVNPEIWDKLTHQAKWRDLRIAAIQKAITKVAEVELLLHLPTRQTPVSPQI